MIHYDVEEFKEIIKKLKGSDKRIELGRIAIKIGWGGISYVAKTFRVGRDTVKKGIRELKSGFKIVDAFNARGRKKAEDNLPNLLIDIKEIVDSFSQTDPKFKSTNLYTKLTVKEVRRRLIEEKQYQDDELPTNQTLNTKINQLGYRLKKVQKTKPLKKVKETDAIFENLNKIHKEIKDKDNIVRISIDTKDRVKIGEFSRGGYSRLTTKAYDHDFGNDYITPFGILDKTNDNLTYVFTKSNVTADFMVDSIIEYWVNSGYYKTKDTLVINADNGPENNSRRTQFMKRLIEFSILYNVKITLAYYPPYHSKYNPIERTWGVLEQHWNGSTLNDVTTVLRYAKTMTWKTNNPTVIYSRKVYETGKKVSKETMELFESVIDRAVGLKKWFVTINPDKCKRILKA